MDDILRTSAVAVNPENTVIDLGDGFTMISVGYSNQTPWDSPRELPEDELAAYIARQAETLGKTDRQQAITHIARSRPRQPRVAGPRG